MSALPFMKFYPSDFLADTTHLSAEQEGAYIRLLSVMWRMGGKLPNDASKLARIAGITIRRWNLVGRAVMEFFTATDGVLTQKRLAEEMQKAMPEATDSDQQEAPKMSLPDGHNPLITNDPPRAYILDTRNQKESPPTPSGGNEEEIRFFREKVWEPFPRNLNSIFEDGLREFLKLCDADRDACAYGVESYRRLAGEMVRKGRPEPHHKRLSAWIAKRGWVGLARVETAEDFVALTRDDPRFAAVQAFRGRPLIVGESGKFTARKTEVAAALAAAGNVQNAAAL